MYTATTIYNVAQYMRYIIHISFDTIKPFKEITIRWGCSRHMKLRNKNIRSAIR